MFPIPVRPSLSWPLFLARAIQAGPTLTTERFFVPKSCGEVYDEECKMIIEQTLKEQCKEVVSGDWIWGAVWHRDCNCTGVQMVILKKNILFDTDSILDRSIHDNHNTIQTLHHPALPLTAWLQPPTPRPHPPWRRTSAKIRITN